ncbi:MAG: alkaline phosphatase PhoX [Snowella sp.]|nr:alkaline phosphatase PhoX [Snowella sp.]
MPNLPFDTNQPSQIKPLEGYRVDPLFTVGETLGDYTPIGILDGTGAFSLNDTTVRVLVNHEVGSDVGYQYTLASGAELTGARISYFDIDKRTLKIIDSGLAFDTIYNRAGEEVTPTTPLDTIEGEFGLDRFCAANLMEAYQFGNGRGFADTIYFAGEETDNGTEFALNVETNELWALPWLGVAAWESVTELDTGTTDKVALLIGDDRGPAPLYLYVGTKGVDYDENGQINFLERNGLTGGNLYAWVADDPSNNADVIEADARDFSGTGNSTKGRFVEVDIYDETGTLPGYDDLGFATQDTQDALAADVNAFLMSRPEDLATNPNKGNQAVVASTGRTGIFDDADVWGTTYIVDVNFTDLANGNIGGDIKILYDGNDFETNGVSHPDYGLRSPDNLDWADDGKIYLQEDRAISSSLFGATSGEEASIWSIDPDATAPETTLTRVAQIDRTGVPSDQTDSSPTDIGNWESSGILDVSTLLGNQPGTVLLFDVQAHSVRDGKIINVPGVDTDGDGTVEANDNLAQGGQLSLLIAPGANLVQDTELVTGTPGTDEVIGGTNNVINTGAGDDVVDVPGDVLAGYNRISTGSGADEIFVGNGDRANGGSGDDYFDASGASAYRLSGGKGNDIFDLGMSGRAIGGDGDDQFYVGEYGDNLLAGGAGADQFWLLTDDPALIEIPNTVTDFTPGVDVIGIMSQGTGVGFANLSFTGNSIALNGDTFATLTGVNTTTLTAADFVFNVN